MQKLATAICLDCNENIVGRLTLDTNAYFSPSQQMARASGHLYGLCADHHSGKIDRTNYDKPHHSKFLVKDNDGTVLGTMRATSAGRDATFTIINQDIRAELLKETQSGNIEQR